MNKKKLTTGLAALALVGVVGVGGSLAWFTDSENKTNSFRTGKVDITLTEDAKGDPKATPNGDGSYSYANVLPGDDLTKTVKVHNNDNDAWVRLVVETNLPDEQARQLGFMIDGVSHSFDFENGKYVSQQDILNKGEEVTYFDSVKIPEGWNNSMSSGDFTIKVTAQAVQVENNNGGFAGLSDEQIQVAKPVSEN